MLFDFEIIVFILHNISSCFYHLNLLFILAGNQSHFMGFSDDSCFEDSTL